MLTTASNQTSKWRQIRAEACIRWVRLSCGARRGEDIRDQALLVDRW
jgi:hypothetical protein